MSKERAVNYSVSIIVILVGFGVLAGWIWDVPALRMLLLRDNVSMKVNVAISLILSGLALILFQEKENKHAQRGFIFLSVCILLISSISLSEDVFQYYAGIDELWVKDEIARNHHYPYPGRMAVATAICLSLESIGFLGLAYRRSDNRERLHVFAQYCFHGISILSFITIMGYIFSVPALFQIPYMPVMAIHTSICLLLLSVGASLLNPSLGITHLFMADRLGSKMARRVFPLVTIAVLVLGSFCVRLHRYGIAEVELGITVCVFFFLMAALYIMCRTAKWLNGIERERNAADKTIRQLYAELEKKVVERSEALYSSEASLRTILDAAEVAYALVDKKMRMILYNQCAYEFIKNELHYEPEIGAPLTNYFPQGREERVGSVVKAALEGESIHYESHYVQADASIHWYDVHVCPVYKDKDVLGLMISVANITERKLSEIQQEKTTNELIQRNKAHEQFTYMVSHNLRAPLANIMGLSSILTEQELSSAEHKEVVDGITTSAMRLDNVIRDLNNILQVKQEIKERKEEVYLSELTNEVKQLLPMQGDSIMIKTDFSSINHIWTLKGYISSVFYNLISNAIKYRREDVVAEIDIYSRQEGEKVVLYFKDNGMGIDMARNADSIFGLYNRFHQHTEGRGMGLFMVKTQIETLGGNISVESEVNKGTQFKIELPLN